MRSILLAAAFAASLVTAACSGGGGGYGGGGTSYGNPPPTTQNCATSPLSSTVTVTANLGIASCNDTTAGAIYAFNNSGNTAQVIVANKNQLIKFHNSDSTTHSADSLGAFSNQSSWPGSYAGAPAASTTGALITATGFSSGALSPGTDSSVYNTGSTAAMVMIGCRFHYDSSKMRTLIIVQ